MVEESRIGEFAIVFIRKKTENDLIVEFIPTKVVDGYYYEDEMCFVDSEQNVYPHIANYVDFGNAYGGRGNALDILRKYPEASMSTIKTSILSSALKYEYFKNEDEDAKDYGIIMMRNKETGEILVYRDNDSDLYYEMYLINDNENKENNETNSNSSEEKIERETVPSYTPSEIIEEVKKTIKGQDEAIEKIVTLLWIKYNFPMLGKTNMMVIGPSGVGKTAIFRKLKEVLNIPIAIYSATGTSQAGYKGHNIEEMLVQLYNDSGRDIEKAENGIIIIDEFDKLSKNRESGEIGTTAVQNELLKLIEGCERQIELDAFNAISMNTSNIIFVGCGAFDDLFDTKKDVRPSIGFGNYPEEKKVNDIVINTETIIEKGGIIRELAGRLPVIIRLNALDRDNLKDILLNSDESEFRKVLESITSLGIDIENSEAIVNGLINDAIEKKIGARGLTSSVMSIFLKIFRSLGDNPEKYEKVIIGNNIINDNTDFKLVPKNVKKRTRKNTKKSASQN